MAVTPDASAAMEARGDYCRQVEAYLCRRNGGHLIRLVGPAFDQVCGWAERGIPVALVQRGIDRYFERLEGRPAARRRPVPVGFCEADVLDVYDDWRRALGISSATGSASGSTAVGTSPGWGEDASSSAASTAAGGVTEAEPRRHASLPAHLERAIARLTALRGTPLVPAEALDAIVRELDTVRARARGVRGAERDQLLDRLVALDAQLVAAILAGAPADRVEAWRRQAADELASFRDRMPRDAWEQAHRACVDQVIRQDIRLPRIALD